VELVGGLVRELIRYSGRHQIPLTVMSISKHERFDLLYMYIMPLQKYPFFSDSDKL